MAENQPTATEPTEPQSTAVATPVEHILPTADAQPILDVLNDLAADEPQTPAEPALVSAAPKSDETREPLGIITSRP